MASVNNIRLRPRSTPVNAPQGQKRLYVDIADGLLKTMDDAGNVTVLGGGGDSGDTVPFNAGNITGATTLDWANGEFQKAALTGNVTLNAPSNGAEGSRLELWLTPSGANRTLSLHASILIPSDSGVSFPKTLTNGDLYIVTLRHNGTAWMLVTLVGGY